MAKLATSHFGDLNIVGDDNKIELKKLAIILNNHNYMKIGDQTTKLNLVNTNDIV